MKSTDADIIKMYSIFFPSFPEVSERDYFGWEIISGTDKDPVGDYIWFNEWYIVKPNIAKYLRYEKEVVYYNNRIGLYVWAMQR